jgi:hypothetical protein
VPARADCRRSNRIVGLEFDHRPDDDSRCGKHLLEQGKLFQQFRVDALSCLIAGPQLISERLNHVIGRNRKVGYAALDHSEHGRENTTNGGHLVAFSIASGGQRIIMAEEFVRAVYEIDFQPPGSIKAWFLSPKERVSHLEAASGNSGSSLSETPQWQNQRRTLSARRNWSWKLTVHDGLQRRLNIYGEELWLRQALSASPGHCGHRAGSCKHLLCLVGNKYFALDNAG